MNKGVTLKIYRSLSPLVITLLACIPLQADALQSWSYPSNGDPRVLSEQGRLMVMLSETAEGKEGFFFIPMTQDANCKNGNLFQPKQAVSAQFNGTLVQLGDACSKDTHYFFPVTDAGRNFIKSLFLTSSAVYLTQGSFSESISAQGFSTVLNQYRVNKSRTGGL